MSLGANLETAREIRNRRQIDGEAKLVRKTGEIDRPILFCLTPVKDEQWILKHFLNYAEEWADHIVVADQGSSDGSQSIAKSFPKTTLVDNTWGHYDEGLRQRLLIDTAREIHAEGKRIFIALDADEALSGNWRNSPEWEKLIHAEPGSVLAFRWLNLLPGCTRGWFSEQPIPFGFVDDGTAHSGESIHSRRLPAPDKAPWIVFEDIKVLHFQYTDWARMKSKQRWYQCWETLNNPDKRAIPVFRQYHHMDAASERAVEIEPTWLPDGADKTAFGSEATSVGEELYRWDSDVLEIMHEYSTARFSRLNIWETDWVALAKMEGRSNPEAFADPRSAFEKWIHGWLAATQPRSLTFRVRTVQQLLRVWGW